MCPLSETRKIGLLLSGGLDSCILLGNLLRRGQRVLPIYVDSGLIWQEAELRSLRQFVDALASPSLEPLVVLHVPLDDVYQGHWSLTGIGVPHSDTPNQAVYLPARNALLLVKAVVCCQIRGIEDLAVGILGTSPFADARNDFFAKFTDAMNTSLGAGLRLHRPFAGLTKQDVMELGSDLPLEWTFSCLSPLQQLHCGQCNKCAERAHAFEELGLRDPTEYAVAAPVTG